MIILGHRGYSARYPQNTILAFKKALEFGADGVELDVWMTRDREVVVSHDNDLYNIFGVDVEIKQSRYHDLLQYDNQGEKIPLLREVYESLPSSALINVELKDMDAVEDSLRIVEEFDAIERTMFSSFNIPILRKLRKLSKKAIIGILGGDTIFSVQFFPFWVYYISSDYLNLPIQGIKLGALYRGLLRMYKSMGLGIALWTVNSPEQLKKMENLPDVIITDEVELFVKYREELKRNGII